MNGITKDVIKVLFVIFYSFASIGCTEDEEIVKTDKEICKIIGINETELLYNDDHQLDKYVFSYFYNGDTVRIGSEGYIIIKAIVDEKGRYSTIWSFDKFMGEPYGKKYIFDYSSNKIEVDAFYPNGEQFDSFEFILDDKGNIESHNKSMYSYGVAKNPWKGMLYPVFYWGESSQEHPEMVQFFSENNLLNVERNEVRYNFDYSYDSIGNIIKQVTPRNKIYLFEWKCLDQ